MNCLRMKLNILSEEMLQGTKGKESQKRNQMKREEEDLQEEKGRRSPKRVEKRNLVESHPLEEGHRADNLFS